MSHPLVDQLRFTRHERLRGLEGITEQDAAHHFGPINCISWNIGHLAWQEQRYWLHRAQAQLLYPRLVEEFAYGASMSTPSLDEMLSIWHVVTESANPFLDKLTGELLLEDLPLEGKPTGQSLGSAMQRMIFHYWYHIGEIQAIRQMLGHTGLPEYVGALEELAPFRRE